MCLACSQRIIIPKILFWIKGEKLRIIIPIIFIFLNYSREKVWQCRIDTLWALSSKIPSYFCLKKQRSYNTADFFFFWFLLSIFLSLDRKKTFCKKRRITQGTSAAVAYAENFHGGISLSCMWWSFLFRLRCLWPHNWTSYSCFQTNVLAKFVDTMCIFFYTHTPYFMRHCT